MVAILAILLIAAVVVGVWVVRGEGPDRRAVGTVVEDELHRLCVESEDGTTVCVIVDRPAEVRDVSAGDCVAVRYTAQAVLLEPPEPSDECPPSSSGPG